MSILEVNNFSVTYLNEDKKILAADDISFSLDIGDSLGIVGESGSGKSTLAMAILRLLSESSTEISGEAIFQGKDLMKLSESGYNSLRWIEISAVFQKSMNALSPIHSIREQVEDIYRVHKPKSTKIEIKNRVLELFALVNLSERVYNLYPHELSGGMLQRVAIAISLLFNPSLIILDEATTALDVVTQGQILSEIKKLEKVIKMTRIMITHDMSVVATVCDKVAVMYAGRLMELGKVKEVIENPIHPYTNGLIGAYPMLKAPKDDLKVIPGSLPDLSERVKGCIFAPRCPKVQDICNQERPEYREVKEGHMAACHFAEVL